MNNNISQKLRSFNQNRLENQIAHEKPSRPAARSSALTGMLWAKLPVKNAKQDTLNRR
jgi:hypothetical protein